MHKTLTTPKPSRPLAYRVEIFCRSVIAIGASYVLSLSSTIVISRALPGSVEQNLLAMMMLSFALFSTVVIFVFGRRSFTQACLIPSALALMMVGLVYLHLPRPSL